MSKIIGITAATPTKGGDGVNVIFADSKEALPANAPTGTLGVVPRERSESGDTTELEQRVAEIERDHATNTGFVMMMGGLAENPENEGKVFGIKDETIVAMDAPSGGGGGGGDTLVTLVPETTMECVADGDNAIMMERPFCFEAGREYVVKWDGVEYSCIAQVPEVFAPFAVIGNAAAVGGNDTGEPFLMAALGPLQNVAVLLVYNDGTHTFSVAERRATTIDPEHIEGSVFDLYATFAEGEVEAAVGSTMTDILNAVNSGRTVRLIVNRQISFGFARQVFTSYTLLLANGGSTLSIMFYGMLDYRQTGFIYVTKTEDGALKATIENLT